MNDIDEKRRSRKNKCVKIASIRKHADQIDYITIFLTVI